VRHYYALALKEAFRSQSPYGAMWFATVILGNAFSLNMLPVAIPLRGYVVCNTLLGLAFPRFGTTMSQSPYGAMWFATSSFTATRSWNSWGRNPLTGLCGLQHSLAGRAKNGRYCRNPLTGLCGLQLYPPKNALLDSTAGGGVCEKDEAWNMHWANNGGFRGFMPMNTRRREGR
jgi:hypothetical protein